MRVLVTGASGFVGRAVLARCAAEATLQVRGAYRRAVPGVPTNVQPVLVGDLQERTDWSRALNGVDVVVHAAARVHVMRDSVADPLAEFRRVNVAGTLNLARQAAAAGVRRIVFISSIKVNGEWTSPGQPFSPADVPAPFAPYGLSKLEAEQGLRLLANETGIEVVIIRPVLVYGPGVKANFLSMMSWVRQGIPLPLGAIHNQRSFVGLDNLTDLILTCLRHPGARNQTFLVSDGDDMSTAELLRRMAAAMGRQSRLVAVPESLLRMAMRSMGKADMAQRLCASLQVDIGKTQRMLDWTPPAGVDAGLAETARWFLRSQSSLHGSTALGYKV